MGDRIASGLVIRAGRQDEIEAIMALWREAEASPTVTDTTADVGRMISAATVLVAEARGTLVGSIFGAFDGWRANIYRLAVHPSCRRQGIARALLSEIEKRLIAQGAKRFAAIVELDHPWAVAFWNAAGYTPRHQTVRFIRNV